MKKNKVWKKLILKVIIVLILDLSFKQNVNNVSSMTNKIELLTNSLSDPDFTGSVNGMYWFLCTLYDRF